MGFCWTYSCSSKTKLKHFISGTLEKNKHWFPLFGEQLILLTQNNGGGMKWIVWVLLVYHTHINTRIQVFCDWVSLGEETTEVDQCRKKRKKLRMLEMGEKKTDSWNSVAFRFGCFLKLQAKLYLRNTAVVITDEQWERLTQERTPIFRLFTTRPLQRH